MVIVTMIVMLAPRCVIRQFIPYIDAIMIMTMIMTSKIMIMTTIIMLTKLSLTDFINMVRSINGSASKNL